MIVAKRLPWLVGIGLFVGSSVVIQAAGPAANLSFLITGVLIILVMRMLGELVLAEGAISYLEGLCQEAVEQCRLHVQGQLEIGAFLFDFDGTLLVNLPPWGE